MITNDSFKIENGRFILKEKPSFDITATVLKDVLTNTSRNLQPERGTDYEPVAEDVGPMGAQITVNYAYVEDGTSGEHVHAVRLQNHGGGRANPPTLVSSARFTEDEANLIVSSIN